MSTKYVRPWKDGKIFYWQGEAWLFSPVTNILLLNDVPMIERDEYEELYARFGMTTLVKAVEQRGWMH